MTLQEYSQMQCVIFLHDTNGNYHGNKEGLPAILNLGGILYLQMIFYILIYVD